MNIAKSLLSCLALMLSFFAFAQDDCNGDKYANRTYYSAVKVTRNIVYGSNKSVDSGAPQTLRLDVHEPEADTLPGRANRPLVIFAHGGSFVTGSRNEAAPLCQAFAKMGYVAATIDYRTGFFFPNERTTTLAVLRAMHDMKAAIRFFRKEAANGNTYAIDTNRIVIGGISAGAITAIHAAYLDQYSEIPSYFLSSDTAGLGGIEGISGNPGYSSNAIAVVNYAGAIGDTTWIIQSDLPITSFHFNGDLTVPYDTREVSVNGLPTGLTASGSGSMEMRLNNMGVVNELTTYEGVGHVEFLSGSDFDTVVNSTMMFLYHNAVCKQSTGIALNNRVEATFEVYPNPSTGKLIVRTDAPASQIRITVYDSMGQKALQADDNSNQEINLDLSHLSKGLYVLSVSNHAKPGMVSSRKLILE